MLCLVLLLLLLLLLRLEGGGLLELKLPVGGHHGGVVHVQASRLEVVHRRRMSMVAAWPAGMGLLLLLLLLVLRDGGLLRKHLAVMT